MTKLTECQRVTLSAAAARDDGTLLPLPSSLRRNKGATTRVLRGLVGKGLAAETTASRDDTVWRLDEDGERLTLVITDQGLAALAEFDRTGCLARWWKEFGTEAPRYLSVMFMRKVLAYEMQCRVNGGLSPKARKALKAAAGGKAGNCLVTLSPGTHLVREWNGRTWRVEVRDDGLHCNGRKYRSLSAIAREITGARWSGHRFFRVAG